jgi:flagellar basal body L-ring protein FlgH
VVKAIVTVSLLIVSLAAAEAESLWSPDFKGYLSGSKGFSKGNTVIVGIDTSSALSFSASNSDSKNLTLEFSGGETGNLFSFLPQVKAGGSQSAKGAQQYKMRGEIPALVTEVDPSGRALVQGSRSIQLQGKEESITVSGWVNRKDVDQKGIVPLSRVGEVKLVFKTLLAPSQPILSDKDIRTIIAAAPAAPVTSGTPAPAASMTPSVAPGIAAQPATPASPSAQTAPAAVTSLTEERKKELLLLYLNRLIDILFSP